MGLTAPTAKALLGWTPVRVDGVDGADGADGEPVVDWCFTEGEEFVDPFFDQTVERCLRNPARLLFRRQTSMATLGAVAAEGDTLPLAGLIFHCSRCGSTLVSQMLAQLESTLVLAEPAPLHSLLATHRTDWLRSMVAALGQRRHPHQQRLVLKLDAWAVLYLPLFRRAFPEAPLVFVYRDPVEVLVSHLGHRGFHMIPGCLPAELLGLEPSAASRLAPEEYMARVLGALLGAMARVGGDARLVNYRELPDAVVSRIAPWLGLEIGPVERAGLSEVAQRDAKNPFVAFEADSSAKQRRANDPVRRASETWVEPAFGDLETLRAAQR